MTFQTFLETKYPLYSDPQMKVNLTVSQLCDLVEEWGNMIKDDLTFEDLEGINQGLKDIEEGRTVDWEDYKKQNGITDITGQRIEF